MPNPAPFRWYTLPAIPFALAGLLLLAAADAALGLYGRWVLRDAWEPCWDERPEWAKGE